MENDLNPTPPATNLPPTPPVPPPPTPPSEPKVIDLSGNSQPPKPRGFFSRGAFLFGIIGLVLLAVVGVGVGWYAVQQRTAPAPKAVGCSDYGIRNFSGGSNGQGPVAWAEGDVFNNCSTPVTVYLIKSWCKFVDTGTNGGCGANTSREIRSLPAKTTIHISRSMTEQQVGNNGTCGSAQVDIAFTQDASGPNDRGATAFLAACKYKVCNTTTQACESVDCPVGKACSKDECTDKASCSFTSKLVCKSVTLGGGGKEVTAGGSTRTLTVASQGGTGAVSFSWAVTADTGEAGTLSSDKGKTVVWTAPATLSAAQNWTITSTATDGTGATDSSGCTQLLTFTPAAVPFTFKTCENNACVSKNCTPTTTDCSANSTCNGDSDCAPATHKECVSNACKSVTGAGDNKCNVDGDCVPATHKECRNSSCQTVSGSGSDSCNADSDCAPSQPQTHKACQNNSCVVVSGAGTDTCTSDVSCKPVAVAPPIPKSGNELFTIGGLILGAGSLLVGLLLIL